MSKNPDVAGSLSSHGKGKFKTKETKVKLTWTKALEIESRLAEICEHSYTRDSYAYAPLYCRHCLLEKEQVLRLLRSRQINS